MTTAAPERVRRSVRFAQVEARTGATGRENAVRRERMTVNSRLEIPSFHHTQDWTGGMGVSPSGRFQVIEEPRKRAYPWSREGLRADWARILIWAAAVIMCVILLVQFASVGAGSLRIQKLERRIAAAEKESSNLQSELMQFSGDISVCTKAVEMNLISSSGAPTILLTAPQGATMTLVETTAAQATEEPEMRAATGWE